MQTVGITLVGAVAATAVFAIQQGIANRVGQLAEERDANRVAERRRQDLAHEMRRRQDELVREMLSDTVAAYHQVKSTRRRLQALTGESPARRCSSMTTSRP